MKNSALGLVFARLSLLVLLSVSAATVAATVVGCDTSNSPPPAAQSDIGALFKNERNESEKQVAAVTQDLITDIRSGKWVKPADPANFSKLLNTVLRELSQSNQFTSGYKNLSPQLMAELTKFNSSLESTKTFLRNYTGSVDTIRSFSTAYAASKVFGAIERHEATLTHSPNAQMIADYKKALDASWAAFDGAIKAKDWGSIKVPYSPPGSDCGEAPPADGTLPSPEGKRHADEYIIGTSDLLTGNADLLSVGVISSPKDSHRLGSLIHAITQQKFDTSPESKGNSVASVTEAYLQAVSSFVSQVVQTQGAIQPAAAKKTVDTIQNLQKKMTGVISYQLREAQKTVSIISSFDPNKLNLDSDTEHEFDFMTNVPTVADGRYVPWFISRPLDSPPAEPMAIGLSDEYTVIIDGSAPTALIPADFMMKQFSRRVDHIDYQLRVENTSNVLKKFRHVPVADAAGGEKIALGHYIDFKGLSDTAGAKYFVVQGVAVDGANHPTPGACNYIKVNYVTQAEYDAQNSSGSLLRGLESIAADPMHWDSLCEFDGQGSLDSFDFPDRTAFVDPGNEYAPFFVSPSSSVSVVNSGEIIEIVNRDSVKHRFVTTTTSYYNRSEFDGDHYLSTGGYEFEKINADKSSTGLFNDTGDIAPGATAYIKLQTGLPMPYYFSLKDVTANSSQQRSVYEQIQLYYYNVQCL